MNISCGSFLHSGTLLECVDRIKPVWVCLCTAGTGLGNWEDQTAPKVTSLCSLWETAIYKLERNGPSSHPYCESQRDRLQGAPCLLVCAGQKDEMQSLRRCVGVTAASCTSSVAGGGVCPLLLHLWTVAWKPHGEAQRSFSPRRAFCCVPN